MCFVFLSFLLAVVVLRYAVLLLSFLCGVIGTAAWYYSRVAAAVPALALDRKVLLLHTAVVAAIRHGMLATTNRNGVRLSRCSTSAWKGNKGARSFPIGQFS